MTRLLSTAMLCGITATLGLLVGPAGSASFDASTLKGAEITFHTRGDDKDHDTTISVYARIGEARIASREAFANDTKFPDWKDNGPFALDNIDSKITKDQVKNGVKTKIRIKTVGHDTWKFNYTITFRFSDNSTIDMKHDPEIKLDQDNREGEWENKPGT